MDLKSNDTWPEIDNYLKTESDAAFVMYAHMKLATAVGILIATLLSATSFVIPLSSYLEPTDLREPNLSRVLLVTLGLTAVIVLLLIVFALLKFKRAVRRAVHKELLNRIDAVRGAADKAAMSIPARTEDFLKHLESRIYTEL